MTLEHSHIPEWSPELGYYAHSVAGATVSAWEPLTHHLRRVAQRSQTFADRFGAGDWGYVAGLWHDLGKFFPEFQQKLCGKAIQVEHAGAGAAHACPEAGSSEMGLVLAFAIAGHHAGLANLAASQAPGPCPLDKRLCDNWKSIKFLRPHVPDDIWNFEIPPLPASLRGRPGKPQDATRRSVAFFTRMLFSALVDADSLETESFYDNQPLRWRLAYDSIAVLRGRLDESLDAKAAGSAPGRVNQLRAQVLTDCRAKASGPRGVYSLSVPTGGGKTLASMSFALNHALAHGEGAQALQRVIVVVPYTSIIEQNVKQYQDVLGVHNVIEHHSNLDDFEDIENNDEQAICHRLACENWDAPIVVTTNVQFFESLFANKKSRCRKLHNIAGSVIVLDEAQNLPISFLHPVLDALRELTTSYGCTTVLCTATQPALGKREHFPKGLEQIREISRNPTDLADQFRRVRVHWPQGDDIVSYGEVAEQVARHPAVLAIVHRRLDAALLTRFVGSRRPGERLFHLSALMCPAHRRQTIAEIHAELACHRQDGRPCRVISTQLVEAGVDLDFPVVFRALAGLDSIAQAAGRCNREGLLDRGDVHVFRAETEPPGATLKRAAQQTSLMLKDRGGALDISDPGVLQEFFKRHYGVEERDVNHIERELLGLNFATVGQKFRLIEDDYQQPVVIPWDKKCCRRIQTLRNFQIGMSRKVLRDLLRGLQPYSVQVQPRQFQTLRACGAIESLLDETVWVLNTQLFPQAYDRQLGLVVKEEQTASAAALVV